MREFLPLLLGILFFASKNFAQIESDYTRDSLLGDRYYEYSKTRWQIVDTCYYYSKKALPLLEKTEQWDKYVYVLCGLSYCYNEMGKFDSMEINNIFTFEEAKRLLPKTNENFGRALNNLAAVYSITKENDLKGLELYKEAYHLVDKKNPVYDFKAGVEENLGDVYFRLGDFETAEKYYQYSIESWQKVTINGKLEIPFIRVAKAIEKKANLYLSLKKYNLAKTEILKGLEFLSLGVPDNNYKTRLVTILLKINLALGEIDPSIHTLQQELVKNKNMQSIQKMKIYHLLGKAYFKKGNFQFASSCLNKSITLPIPKKKVRDKVSSYQTLAEVYFLQKKYQEALKNQHLAIRLLSTEPVSKDFLSIPKSTNSINGKLAAYKILNAKGATIHQLYQANQLDKYLQANLENYKFLSLLTSEIRSFYQSDESQLLLLNEAKDFYESAITTSYLLFEKNQNPYYLENAFYFFEKSKSELLLDELQKKEFLGKGIIPDSLIKKQYEIKTAINNYNKFLKQEQQKGSERNESKIKNHESSIFDLQKELVSLLDFFKKNYPTYSTLTQQQPITLNDLQNQITDDQILLEYFIGEKNIYLFKITTDETKLIKIPLDFNLDQLIVDFYDQIKMSGNNGIENYCKTAHTLFQKLLPPDQIGLDKKHLIIIPDGQLENLPFDLLVTSSEIPSSPKKVDYLIRDAAVSYAYSATIFSNQNQTTENQLAKIKGVFPIFEGTKKELSFSEDVLNSLQHFSGDFLKEEEATFKNFLNDIQDYQVIHFSTHAQGKDAIHQEPSIDLANGAMLLSDLQTYNLSASLAVLSACETNVGEYRKGEGIMSLSRGFTFAGVPSIITSTANVYEKSTSEIMQNLYNNLAQQLPKHEALRQAKLQYLNSENLTIENAAPYFWGTFLAIGNMDSINFKKQNTGMTTLLIYALIACLIFGSTILFFKKNPTSETTSTLD